MAPKTSRKRPKRAAKQRLDALLLKRGLAPSLPRAQALILSGAVRVNGQAVTKAGTAIFGDAEIHLAEEPPRFASRGGLKLEGALEDFGISAEGKICLDAGSSTGGFTDCLLQRGARRAYAVDVNTAQLDWKLRQDARVEIIERNARYLKAEDIAEAAELVTVDVSFISVAKILPALAAAAAPGADFLILVKPQFELGREEVGEGGIVRDAALHERAIERVREGAVQAGLEPLGVRASHITGAEGNQEFFIHARRTS